MRHIPYFSKDYCALCDQPWPCEGALDESMQNAVGGDESVQRKIAMLRERVAELESQVEEIRWRIAQIQDLHPGPQ